MNSHPILSRFPTGPALLGALALCLAPDAARAAASIVIVNNNAPGVGFNDPTPVAAVGGNSGTTLGQQRLNAFQHAADIWGATIDSEVSATREPRPRAATIQVFRRFIRRTLTSGSVRQVACVRPSGKCLRCAGMVELQATCRGATSGVAARDINPPRSPLRPMGVTSAPGLY